MSLTNWILAVGHHRCKPELYSISRMNLTYIQFVSARGNQRWNCFKSDKVAEISYASKFNYRLAAAPILPCIC